jgi:cyclic beta-1,2-glucan synthetase
MNALDKNCDNPIKGEIYSVERLEEYASYLAQQLILSENPKISQPLLSRMRDNGTKILDSYRTLTKAIHSKETIPPAAEWLIDNFHIVEDQLREIQEDLPISYYKELPKLAVGELSGYPRVYALALALVAHTDSQLELQTIQRFVEAFQKTSALSIGELWALAITLRLVLVENLRRIALSITEDHEKRNLANQFSNELCESIGNNSKFQSLLLKMPSSCNATEHGDCAYLAQMTKRLRDHEPELWPAFQLLEKLLEKEKSSPELVVDHSHKRQSSNQITVANIITSMRLLSSINWRNFFENLSLVDRILSKDPVYKKMDFITRDRYRHVIEKISKKSRISEIEIAEKVILKTDEAQAIHPVNIKHSHVGYFLIGEGLTSFEKLFKYKLSAKLFDSALARSNFIYFGLLGFLLTFICAGPIYYSLIHGASPLFLVGILALIIIPCSELALSIENLILTNIIRPKNLPKLDLTSGIPQDAKTMIVIPCMLSSIAVIKGLLEKLEIHYLGNSDDQLYFALLTDFTDATSESQIDDELKLNEAANGIYRLNQKYSANNGSKFFLFHRRRQWNESEGSWMGWERKRGKIQEFNQILRGAKNTSFTTITANSEFLATIRYVITLDADTQLPRDSARKLVGTILHPLNQPYFDKKLGRVTQGYGVLQPRIGISIESSTRSIFAKVFSGYTGIDPYTTAVSEVYQDLFYEGSYTGKGLYVVDTFEASLAHRAPENTILSHDLFEGLYARAALLTDVELLDDYPQSYHSYFTRQHRWTRGDWQIGMWILPYVKNDQNKWVRNSLTLISKWKIFDNLRRSLVAPITLLWLILAFLILPGSPLFWISCAAIILILPNFAHAVLKIIILRFGKSFHQTAATETKIKNNIWQSLLYITFLAHQAVIQLDAISRVLYRSFVSKKKLLEWATAANVENQISSSKKSIWQSIIPTEFLLVVVSLLFIYNHNLFYKPIGLFLVLIWMSYPVVANHISKKLIRNKKILTNEDRLLFRQLARRTWHYFEVYVNADSNWLPPDNHQEFPSPVTAQRTSPTNIGLYILALMSARDFGYIGTSRFIRLLNLTLATLQKMEKHEGHYLNWYDTKTLNPLIPKYVSTVDSGNLAGYFLAGHQACIEIPNSLAINTNILKNLEDTLSIIADDFRNELQELNVKLIHCRKLLVTPSIISFRNWEFLLQTIQQSFEEIQNEVLAKSEPSLDKRFKEIALWLDICLSQISEERNEIAIFAPWTTNQFIVFSLKLLERSPPLALKWNSLISSLDQNMSLVELSNLYDSAIIQIEEIKLTLSASSTLPFNLLDVLELFKTSKSSIEIILNGAVTAAHFMNHEFEKMNFNFLMDQDREVFSIGYSVSDGKYDSGFYDLLGSESRLASFIAIAKGDVPQEHWFRLGRQLVPIADGKALISWTASMFEYLMPLLVMRDYENTLLDKTSHTVVARQIEYGRENNVPWGVSEAGYNARDFQLNYQYGPFGIPGLGLKRGLSHDLVISPYSTFLAAMLNPHAALKNFKLLIKNNILTTYGFYEAIDYTAERLPDNQNFAVIKSFMAHHQGMSLAAINNVLNDDVIQNRFHKDPRVQATRLLLQERIPEGVIPILPKAAEIETEGPQYATLSPLIRSYNNPSKSAPHIQLLSNRNYSIMISTSGAGYSKCNGLAVTRWREDGTRDNWGSYIFINDYSNEKIWSTSYQPFAELPKNYRVTFREEKVEFLRRDGDISSYTQILVAPEDNVEIRHVTLTNHSDKPRALELTSYLEPVLGPLSNDLDHPAFSKLFIQTEFLVSKSALLSNRRKRSSHDKETWGIHVVVTDGKILSDIQYETDREKFVGRGHTLDNSVALFNKKNLSNTSGASLDPILSLRVKVQIPPKSKVQVAFTTGLATSREEALELADRYHDIHSFDRELKLAWTKSQVDMRHLNIDSETAYLYQRLAERILYSDPTLRPPAHIRAANTNVQSTLWPSGISGDLPIVVVRIRELRDLSIIRQLLRCHEYLRLKGLVYDFVILNEHETTYLQDLQDELQQQIRTIGVQGWLNKSGGIFILRTNITPASEIAHVRSVARISLSADESLKEQINRKIVEEKYPPLLSVTPSYRIKSIAEKNPALKLDFYNGFGGFSQNGKEYIILLQPGLWTPSPWINVIGNKCGFGFQISESGSGFTWSINSQTNRLTPWSNDPICDPSGEIIYLRDDDTGEIWTATPLPIRTESQYTIKHGQGYSVFEHESHGIHHTLTLFIPKNDLVKISILNLINKSKRKRRISVTSYTEWVLGSQREKTSPFLVCDVDQASGAIFARNPHDNEFSNRIAFADFSFAERTFTCSRKEFLGRNGSYSAPAALKRRGLSKKRGTGQDPCAVLQSSIKFDVGEQHEISILLGQTESAESARELTLKYRDLNFAKLALQDVTDGWNKILTGIQIKTPDEAMNLMINNWLLYQTLSCRYWARTAFYQSGGAYGFRDQLQDCMAFVYSAPQIAKEQILRAAEHQFKEGDVQHWWHPPTGRGIRTRMSDDLLWLPYVVSFYVKTTGDSSILKENAPFLEAPLLKPEEEDSYTLPNISLETGTIFEHCKRAIDHALTVGKHGLPFIGTGDWNDGMNRVGPLGQGESIWLGWFLYKVLADFIPFCNQPEQIELKEKYEMHMKSLKVAIEADGWDGDWYRRAYFDDDSILGSVTNDECKIDSIAQSWAILSNAGDRTRAELAMQKVSEFLIRKESQLVLLFTPPFDKTEKDPGYIKGYLPGVRENGGQYTHAAVWVMMAYAELGEGNKAYDIFKMLNPIFHSKNKENAIKYKIEPYVMAGDVYSGASYEGRGGWSWYTGSSAWFYRGIIESILGLCLRGNKLSFTPCIPNSWNNYELTYIFERTKYNVKINNPHKLSSGHITISLDGINNQSSEIELVDDGKDHNVLVNLNLKSDKNPLPNSKKSITLDTP